MGSAVLGGLGDCMAVDVSAQAVWQALACEAWRGGAGGSLCRRVALGDEGAIAGAVKKRKPDLTPDLL